MRTTNNYGWQVPTKTDVADIEKVSQTFDEIDEGLKRTMDNVSEELANRYTKSELADLLAAQDAKILALKRAAFYMPGDEFTVEGTTAGYVTNDGNDFWFMIALRKAIWPGTNIVHKHITTPGGSGDSNLLTVRQNRRYFIGDASGQDSMFKINTFRVTENAILCNCSRKSGILLGVGEQPINNDPVGVWYTFKLYAEQV